jgi:hypothetical protein
LRPGDPLRTKFADGEIVSRIELQSVDSIE